MILRDNPAPEVSSIYQKSSTLEHQRRKERLDRTHVYKLVTLSLKQILHRDPCCARDNRRDVVRCHALVKHPERFILLAPRLRFLVRELLREFRDCREPQPARFLEVALPLRDVQLVLCVLQPLLELFRAAEARAFYESGTRISYPPYLSCRMNTIYLSARVSTFSMPLCACP
jgi:hypothetical protein